MSQIASFVSLPIPAVRLLIPAAVRRKRWFGAPESKLESYLREHGNNLGIFEKGDGMAVLVAVLYLRRFANVNLLDSDPDAASLSRVLSKHQDTFFAVFTGQYRAYEATVRTTDFDEAKIKALCDEEGIDCEAAKNLDVLKAAAECIAAHLALLTDDNIILASVG